MQLKTEPRNYTDKALGIVRDVLREFAGPILERNLGPDHYLERARSRTFQSGFDGERAPSVDDPLFWLRVVSGDLWHSIFKHQLHSQVKVVCGDLVQMRHAWAHSEEATEGREWNASFLTRCLDLLSKVPGGKESYRDLQELREELLNDASSSAQQALEINVAQEVTTPVRPPAKRGGSKPQHPLVKDLDPDQAAVVASFLKEDPEGRVLRGAPGSGKTHVLLRSLCALLDDTQLTLDVAPERQVLFTTFANALERHTSAALDEMLPSEQRRAVDVRTANRLAQEVALGAIGPFRLVDRRAIGSELAKAWDEATAGRGLASGFDRWDATREIENVIAGWGVKTFDEYLSVDRRGSPALRADDKKLTWDFYCALHNQLRGGSQPPRYLYNEVFSLALDAVRPTYDYVFIDEAQDLTPTAVRFITKLCRDPRKVSIAIDRSQAIYGPIRSWRSLDETLDFRGRAAHFKSVYRVTLEIAEAVAQIDPVEDPDRLEHGHRRIAGSGPKPILAWVRSDSQWGQVLNTYLHDAIGGEGLNLRDAVVLCPTGNEVDEVVSGLDTAFNPKGMSSRTYDPAHDGVRVMTMHAAKGMGFPIVAVVGVDHDRLPPRAPIGRIDEHTSNLHRRLLYVACTRAANRLLIVANADRRSDLLHDVQEPEWQIQFPS